MGGDLHAGAGGRGARASWSRRSRTRSAGNLDRIQIVKGWLDAEGKTQEKVYDVVWSGDRKPGADGKVPLVGNTVDVAKPPGPTRSARLR